MRLLIGLFIACISAIACTPKAGYSFCAPITLNHGQFGGTDTANYTIGFSATCNGGSGSGGCGAGNIDYRVTGSGGKVHSSSGFDIVFTSDSAGTVSLACEQESYTSTTGAVAYWIGPITLTHSADVIIYTSFGNAGISTAQCPFRNGSAWGSNYLTVVHCLHSSGTFTGATQDQYQDSTSNGFDFNGSGTITGVSGAIGGGCKSSTSSPLSNSGTGMPSGANPRTLEVWFNVNGNTFSSAGGCTTCASIIGYGSVGSSYGAFALNGAKNGTNNQLFVNYDSSGGPNNGTGNVPDSNWHYYVAVYPASVTRADAVLVYLDGVLQTMSSNSNTVNTNTTGGNASFIIGRVPGTASDEEYVQSWDEPRWNKIALSADYATANYNMVHAPATFFTAGSTSAAGGNMPPAIF